MNLQDNLNIHEMPVKKENKPALKQLYVDDWLIYDKRSKTKTLKTKLFDTRYKKRTLRSKYTKLGYSLDSNGGIFNLKANETKSQAATTIKQAFINRPLKPFSSSSEKSRAGDITTSYFFKVQGEYDAVMNMINRAMKYVPSTSKAYYQILAKGQNQQFFGKPFVISKTTALQDFNNVLIGHLEKYEENFDVSEIIIKMLVPNPKNGAGGRSMITANKIWKFISSNSTTNCMYSAAVLSLHKTNHQAILKEPKGVSGRAKDLTYRIDPTNKAYSDDVDMQALATYKKSRVVLYNNLFGKVKTFIPVMGKVHASRVVKRDDIEILHDDFNHYQAMLRRKDIDEWDLDVKTEEKKVKKCTKINKRVTLKPFDDKFVSWDLECSPNGTADGVHNATLLDFHGKKTVI